MENIYNLILKSCSSFADDAGSAPHQVPGGGDPLTNGVKAVDVQAGRAALPYMDLLQGVVRVVGQYDLHRHHAGLVQTWLSGEMVLGRQPFSRHVVQQLVGFYRTERRRRDLNRQTKKKHSGLQVKGCLLFQQSFKSIIYRSDR